MKKQIIYYFAAMSVFLLLGHQQLSAQQDISFEWAKRIGGSGSDQGRALATDNEGNVIVGGQAGAKFDIIIDSSTIELNITGTNGFIAKLNAAGDILWLNNLGDVDKGSEYVYGLDTDDSGNVYAVGYFTNSIDLNPDPVDSFVLRTRGSNDIYVVKYDRNGKFIWGQHMAGAGADVGYTIKASKDGSNVYVGGRFATNGILIKEGATAKDSVSLTSIGGTDVFIAQLNEKGDLNWVQQLGNPKNDEIAGIGIDADNNVYATGTFMDSFYLRAPSGSTLPDRFLGISSSSGKTDAYITKFDPTGNLVWFRQMGGEDADTPEGIAVSEGGDVYIIGKFASTFGYFGVDTLYSFGSTKSLFLAKVDSSGESKWTKQINGMTGLVAYALDVDKFSNVYYTGYFTGPVDFDPGDTRTDSLISSPNASGTGYVGDIYVSKHNPEGDHVWAKNIAAGLGGKTSYAIAIGKRGEVYTTGYFGANRITDFDPSTAPEDTFHMTPDGIDVFIHKMHCDKPSETFIDTLSCTGGITFMGDLLTAEGTYSWVVENAEGCDSTITLNLAIDIIEAVINVNGFELGTAETYSTYQWLLDGQAIEGATDSTYTVTENGEYQVVVTNENGCVDTSDTYGVNNVSVKELDEIAKTISLFPNPTRNIIHIKSPLEVNVVLTSLEGKIISKIENATVVSLESLANGIYFLTVADTEGAILKVEKVVKQ